MVCFQTKNPEILEGLIMEDVVFRAILSILRPNGKFVWLFGTFCGHLVHFVVIWYILWSFGTFCGHLVHFVIIWYILWSFCRYIVWSFGTFCGQFVSTLCGQFVSTLCGHLV
jgi:hypothetical protein